MAGEHGFDGGSVTLREPEALRVFIDDECVAVTVRAAKQHNCVVGEPVIERGPPFARSGFVKIVES